MFDQLHGVLESQGLMPARLCVMGWSLGSLVTLKVRADVQVLAHPGAVPFISGGPVRPMVRMLV